MPISYKNKIYTTLGTPTGLSGNVVSATDSAGVPAKDYAVKGKTVVWNQLLDKSKYPATTTINGVTFTNNDDGTITANGTATANAIFSPIGLSNPISIVSGHKFLFISCPPGGSLNTYYSDLKSVPDDETSYDVGNGVIMVTASTVTGLRFNIHVISGYTANNLIFKPQLFDLTQMFGAGNEPATVAEFRAMFPDDYYPYNVGELKSIEPTSVEASGVERFQMLDKSKYPGTTTQKGIAFTNNGDGTITANGTAAEDVWFQLVYETTSSLQIGHKMLLIGCPSDGGVSRYFVRLSNSNDDIGNGKIFSANRENLILNIFIKSGYTANNVIFKPQLFDLTQMFGAGNEPATPAEFWQKVPEKLYGYNPNDYKSVNIPSSKYFPDGMRSAGSAYDEINFLSQKAIKRVGVRAYQTGDENDANVMTDKINTVYILSTPVETEITPPLQALQTFKGFTSFSAPNSLTQNGPLSVTYYAEGGANPEKGWLTSYKRKLYMGRNIEWNQLLDKSKFDGTQTKDGITVKNNKDGTFTINGAFANSYTVWFRFYNDNDLSIAKRLYGHKVLYGFVQNPSSGSQNNEWGMMYEINNSMYNGTYIKSNLGKSASIATLNKVAVENITKSAFYFYVGPSSSGTAVYKNVVIRPQLFDLTQMFGAGNEPATPAEFWSYFDHKLYPYNPGEAQPLFKISRKSQWGSATAASLYVGEDIIIPQIVRN